MRPERLFRSVDPTPPPAMQRTDVRLAEILLYDVNDSPFCLKARICLNVKGVPFRRVPLTVGRLRELRRINPLGKVPVLVQDETVIPDSSRIIRHLEAEHRDPVLIPPGKEARAYACLLEEWADEALYFIVGAFKWLNPANRDAALANTVNEMSGVLLRPLVGRMMAWRIARRYAAWGYGPGALEHFAERMRENLATLSTLLDGKDYLLGRVPTVADVAVFAQLTWMRRYAERDLLDDAPVVRDWLDAFAALPPVAAALAS